MDAEKKLINHAKEFLETRNEITSVLGEHVHCIRVNNDMCIAVDSKNNLAYKVDVNGNTELIDTVGEQFGSYKVSIPVEETARVSVDYVFYTDTKEEAEKIVEAYNDGEGYKVKNPDVIETIDFLDTWNTEMFPEDASIEELKQKKGKR